MKVLYTLLFSILSIAAYAQDFYDIETVQTIEVTFAESNWDQLMDNAYANDAGYILAQSVTINGVEFDSVGVKYKGNSTYRSTQVKNPWHIELDTYKDHEYDGYTDIKLANGSKDPSMIRDVLAYDVLRQYMAAPEANFANLYVNGDLIGVYANTESISKKFMGSRFGSKDNTRFKCSPPAGAGPQSNDLPDLVYLGQDSTDYYAGYELKSDAGWQELIDLCDTLANQTDAIEEILDVDRTLWMLAFDNVIVNLDSYIGKFQQNYYLYRSDEGQFLPVVWDLNESFGVFPLTGTINLNGTTGKQQMTHLLHENDNQFPLVQKLLADPTYKRMYIAHMKTILQENFANGEYADTGEMLQEIIDESVQADDNKFYTYNDFISNLTSDLGGGGGGPGGGGPGGNSAIGIISLMDNRSDYLLGLGDFADTEPSVTNISLSNDSPKLNENIIITASIADATNVVLGYRSDDITAPFTKVEMFDDGTHGDGAANDGVYGADVTIADLKTDYYVYAENDKSGLFSPRRAQYEFYEINATANTSTDGVVINEFMASNDMTMTDPDEEFEDWIELYNNSAVTVDLSGSYLSDDGEDLTLWAFPEGTSIGSGEFLIIWADGDLDQEGLHADFKLSAGGESVILTASDGTTIVDVIEYTEQTTDISFARIPNGTGDFQLNAPTFNANNEEGVDCTALGGDADNDGICADDDCDDSDASIGAAQESGTACNDGNDATVVDIIDLDGCTCSGIVIIPGDLVINELMASNEFTVVDQDGEAEDWIELYNNSAQNIDLTGYFLSQEFMDIRRWEFPNGTTIAAGGYLTIWADEDLDQDGLHADFKLSNGGESIILANGNTSVPGSTIIVDAVDYPEQTTDISYGRFPNGTGSFQFMNPTFGATNSNMVSTVDISASNDLKVYPNPASSEFFLEFSFDISKQRSVTIFHISGKQVYQNTVGAKTLISTADWRPGMYIIRSDNAVKKLIKN